MIRALVDFALNNKVVVIAIGMLLLGWGAIAFHNLPVEAYPDRMFRGKVSNIGSILDPNIRTAKVRLEVENPGIMRLGMFVKATFRGQTMEMHTSVPETAILHIHDRDYVYVPAPDNKFRRIEVVSGDQLPGHMQEVKSGIKVGQQVVSNALVLERTIDQ